MARGGIVGRLRELAEIAEAMTSGETALVVITGEAGIGKSSLVTAAAAALERTPLLANCLSLTEALPLLPAANLLRLAARIDQAWFGDATTDLPDWAAQILRLVVPDLVENDETDLAAESPADPWVRQQLFAAFGLVMSRLAARRPTMTIIEDVHWADGSTLDMLSVVAAGGQDWGGPAVVTFRTEDPSVVPAAVDWLERVWGIASVQVIELSALDPGETAELVENVTREWPSADRAAEIFARSEGNPLFIEQLSRFDSDPLPESVVAGFARSLAMIGPDALELARVLAVAGRSLTHADLAILTDLGGAAIEAAVQQLRTARLLNARLPRSVFRLRHALLVDAVLSDIPFDEFRRLHQQTALWLSNQVSPKPDAEIARHWQLAECPSEEFAARVVAAHAAHALHAYREEADHWSRILQLWPTVPAAEAVSGTSRFDAVLAADWSLMDSGQGERNTAMLRDELARLPGTMVRERATLQRRLARMIAWRNVDEALSMLDAAAELFETAPGGLDWALLLADMIDVRRSQGRSDDAVAAAERAVAECVRMPEFGLERSVRGRRALALAYAGRTAEASAEIDRLPEAPAGSLRERLVATLRQIETLARLERHSEVEAATADLLAEADRYGAYGSRLINAVRAGVAASFLRSGRVDDARGLVESIVRDSPPEDRQLYDPIRAEIALLDGDLVTAQRLATGPEAPADPRQQALDTAARAAEILLWVGRPADVVDAVTPFLESALAPGFSGVAAQALLALLRAYGDLAESRTHRQQDRAQALAESVAARPLVHAHSRALWDAELARLNGIADPQLWSRAAELSRDVGLPFDSAYSRWREAEALLSGRARREADAILKSAHAAATGHQPLTAAIERTARAARIDLAPAAPPVRQERAFGLTERELTVLIELATGKTNPQIGAVLFMSPKTVSVHVSSIMRKLAAESRTQAVAIAQRSGVIE